MEYEALRVIKTKASGVCAVAIVIVHFLLGDCESGDGFRTR